MASGSGSNWSLKVVGKIRSLHHHLLFTAAVNAYYALENNGWMGLFELFMENKIGIREIYLVFCDINLVLKRKIISVSTSYNLLLLLLSFFFLF
ncbi:hypothetical protein CDL12_17629 [Handroanthus impetiginosus]|uniref:Uncharacterized protein n=1 Tax=Handroanthus impetiginosus TaxID=429701 RepID=A0A2G9GWY9_9LAMI|nr:hypothetical protein CDL12_17629 [Handroanthus impetiginosus]